MAPIASHHLMESPPLEGPTTTVKRELAAKSALTTASPPSAPCLVTDFIRYQVQTNPNALAVHCEHEEPCTYSDLWHIVEQIFLNARFAGGSIVPVCLDIGIEFVATLLAIMVSGAAYVIFDPEGSQERNRAIASDTSADSVVSSLKYASSFERVVLVEDLLSTEAAPGHLISPLAVPGPSPSDLAYLIYTSGKC